MGLELRPRTNARDNATGTQLLGKHSVFTLTLREQKEEVAPEERPELTQESKRNTYVHLIDGTRCTLNIHTVSYLILRIMAK